jgi:glutamate:GABA antiporter
LATQWKSTANNAYYFLVDATNILYFIPFVYIYAAVIRLAYVGNREGNTDAVLIPGGKIGVWIAGSVAMVVTILAIAFSFIPSPGETKWIFELKLVLGTIGFIGIGLILYYRGWSAKRREAALQAAD